MMKKSIVFIFISFISVTCFGQKLTPFQKDSIKADLVQMEKDDQKYRWQMMLGELDSLKIDSIKKLPKDLLWKRINSAMTFKVGFGKFTFDSLLKLQNDLDSLNKIKFLGIVKKYGYPSFKRTGNSFSGLITIHMVGKKEFDELLPIFKQELHKRNMPANEFAAWYDRCQLNMNKQQLYGEYNSEYPCVANLVITNQERKKIGLKKIKKNKCR